MIPEPPTTAEAPSPPAAAKVSNGALAMWIFLSTEAMFFGALLGAYLIMRLSAPPGGWPSAGEMHVALGIGLLNTAILLISSWTLRQTIRHARTSAAGPAKQWLAATTALALAFLGVKAFEYWEKYQAGILNAPHRSRLYDRADLYYLAAVREALSPGAAAAPTGAATATGVGTADPSSPAPFPSTGDPQPVDSQPVDPPRLVRAGLADWAAQRIGRTDDPLMRQRLLESVAHAIHPSGDAARVGEFLDNERREVAAELRSLEDREQVLRVELEELQRRIESLQQALAGESPPTDRAPVEAELASAIARAGDLSGELTRLKMEIDPRRDRLRFLDWNGLRPGEGLNERLGWRLPMVIPNGNTWVNNYILLTGCHGLHVLAGAVIFACLLPLRLNRRRLGLLQNVSLYWIFVDGVWLIILPIVYLS